MADIQGAGWRAEGIAVEVEPGTDALAARIRIQRITLAATPALPRLDLEDVRIVCAQAQTLQPELRCRDALVSGRLGPLGAQRLRADVAYHRGTGALRIHIRDLKLAGGRATLQGRWRKAGWDFDLHAEDAQLPALQTLLKPWFALPGGFSLDGRVSLQARVRGAETIEDAEIEAGLAALTLANAEGTLATDQLAMKLNARLRPAAQGWAIEAALSSASGQAYVDPVFVDLAQQPLEAAFAGRWMDPGALAIDRLDFNHSGIARGNATGRLDLSGGTLVQDLAVRLEALQFPGAYAVLMQPFLLTGDFRDLDTRGSLHGTVRLAGNAPAALDLTLSDITALDKQGKLGIEQLNGRVVWSAGADAAGAASHLAWTAANAYGLSGGAARLAFMAAGDDVQLLEPARIPVLDGALAIHALSARDMGTAQMALRFEGAIEPISMPRLAAAFGWPEFAGTLSGRIPEISYDGEVLSVGGALEAEAFGGRITVHGLELRQPLGRYPRLKADVVLRGLDLEAVTGTFSFGSITGGLDGEIRGLELFQWTPIRMDLRLYTPAGDRKKHLISQRAVNNLSSIGGGGGSVAAALQGGVLRFFENFRYRRLGISCRLENEVCLMDGVAPASGGAYYIVQGSGLPRIDIIGNSRRVDWPRLVEQLKAIQSSGGPVVQ